MMKDKLNNECKICMNMSFQIIPIQIRNIGFHKTCLDSPTRKSDHHKPVGLYPCHRQGGNQVFCRSQLNSLRQYHLVGDYVVDSCFFYNQFILSLNYTFALLFYARRLSRISLALLKHKFNFSSCTTGRYATERSIVATALTCP